MDMNAVRQAGLQVWQKSVCESRPDVSGLCMSVSLILGFNLDFSSCDNWDAFCKSSHIFQFNHIKDISRKVVMYHPPLFREDCVFIERSSFLCAYIMNHDSGS